MSDQLSVQDRLEIAELLARYAWSIDTLDVEGYANVFAPDGVLILRGVRHEGREAIRQYARQMFDRSSFPGRQHHNDQVIIQPHPAGASVRSYSQISQRFEDGTCQLLLAGRYFDICVKQEGRWLFAERDWDVWTVEGLERSRLGSA